MSLNMIYNTQQTHLVFKEYGRNIQQLIGYAIDLEDRRERSELCKAILNLMGQMHPHLRNIEEFRHKLWYQLHTIADFKLDIDGPYPIPTPEEVIKVTGEVPYPQERIRFKHYGKNVEVLVAKAMKMEDLDKRHEFAKVIANYMKMVYRNWNRENVNDELIKNDLRLLSNNLLSLDESTVIEVPKQSNNNNNNGRNNNNKRNHKRNNNKNGKDHHRSRDNHHNNGYRKRR